MSTINQDQDYNDALRTLMRDMDGRRLTIATKRRIGTVRLNDDRKGQIHLIVTTDKDEFLPKPRARRRPATVCFSSPETSRGLSKG